MLILRCSLLGVKTTLVERATALVIGGAVRDFIVGRLIGEAKGVGPLDNFAGLAISVANDGALGLRSGVTTGSGCGGNGLLCRLLRATSDWCLVAPTAAAVHRAGLLAGGGGNTGRDGLALTVAAGVAALRALIAGAAETDGAGTTRAVTAAVNTLGARAVRLILAPLTVNLAVVKGSLTATNKEIVTVDTGLLNINRRLADRVRGKETVGLDTRVNGITTIVAVQEGRHVVGGCGGRDGAEERIGADGGTGGGHRWGTKVVAARVPAIGLGSLRVNNRGDWNVALSIVGLILRTDNSKTGQEGGKNHYTKLLLHRMQDERLESLGRG